MKIVQVLSIAMLLCFLNSDSLKAQSKDISPTEVKESLMVTFKCESCTKKNKFSISGPEKHTFKLAKFPLKVELKPGEYEMTYWQNRIQQINLPFSVSSDSENIIVVKD